MRPAVRHRQRSIRPGPTAGPSSAARPTGSAGSRWPGCSTRRSAPATARGGRRDRPGDRWRGVVNPPHLPVKAKRVIHLCMAGGPSQFESFDYKPKLKRARRQAVPRVVHEGAAARPAAEHGAQGARAVRASSTSTAQSGQEISDLFPHIAGIADDICIVRSMHDRADQPRPGARVHELAARSSRAGRAWARGCSTAWAPRPTTCPASSCSPRPGQDGPAAGLGPAVVGRLPAEQVPGHPVPVARATPSTTSATPPGVCQSTQRQSHRGGQPAQRHARRGPARPRDPDPDRPVRAGVPDAGRRSPS